MSQRFAVVHEAEADFHTATALADRVLIDAIDWLDEHLLAEQREWVGMAPGSATAGWTRRWNDCASEVARTASPRTWMKSGTGSPG